MGNENDFSKPSMYDDHDDPKQYFILEFETDADLGVAYLKMKGPKGPKAFYTESAPQIKIYNKDGKYVVETGISKSSIEKNELPEAFKPFFGKKNIEGLNGPVRVQMPWREDLTSDGRTFKNYEEYQKMVQNRANSVRVGIGSILLKNIPKPIYESLIDYYRKHDKYGNPWYL